MFRFLQLSFNRATALLVGLAFILFQQCPYAQDHSESFTRVEDGVLIYPDSRLSGNAQMVKLQVMADDIIRVIASAEKSLHQRNSLAVNYSSTTKPMWDVRQEGTKLTLATKELKAVADLQTGAVSFTDLDGKIIIGERAKPAGPLLLLSLKVSHYTAYVKLSRPPRMTLFTDWASTRKICLTTKASRFYSSRIILK